MSYVIAGIIGAVLYSLGALALKMIKEGGAAEPVAKRWNFRLRLTNVVSNSSTPISASAGAKYMGTTSGLPGVLDALARVSRGGLLVTICAATGSANSVASVSRAAIRMGRV